MCDGFQILPNSPEDNEEVDKLLDWHSKQQGVDFVEYNYHMEEDGKLIAGITAWAMGSDVHIDTLAVDEAHRRDGLGAALLAHVEAQAKANGCTTACVDTFSYQAPDYYPRHGYEVIFRYPLDDGTERIYFSKRL